MYLAQIVDEMQHGLEQRVGPVTALRRTEFNRHQEVKWSLQEFARFQHRVDVGLTVVLSVIVKSLATSKNARASKVQPKQ